jgi:uncharacterized protein YkwD
LTSKNRKRRNFAIEIPNIRVTTKALLKNTGKGYIVKKSYLFAIAMAASVMVAATGANAANCALPGNAAEIAAKTLQLTNDIRAQNGRKPLAFDPRLQAAAQAHACDMAVQGYFSHRGKDGSTSKRRLSRQGCHGGLVAENIAIGQTDSLDTVQSWMDSPGHRKIMLLGRGVDHFGLGVALAGNAYTHGYVWVMVVSRRC